ncbi:hypothetical protein ACNOYE_29360 [Nannocystaceae bacterium ST9]
MNSPDVKPQEGGGGMLPALLAGAGILIVAGLLIFGGGDDDDDAAKRSEANKTKSASSQSKAGGGKSGMASREVDEATSPGAQNKPKLNPRIANSIVTGGMAPDSGKKEEPTSFASVDDEITYWEDELREANRMLEIRERAVEHIPQIEEAIKNGNDPVNGLKEFENRKKVVNDNLDRAKKRVEEVEGKLAKLGG